MAAAAAWREMVEEEEGGVSSREEIYLPNRHLIVQRDELGIMRGEGGDGELWWSLS